MNTLLYTEIEEYQQKYTKIINNFMSQYYNNNNTKYKPNFIKQYIPTLTNRIIQTIQK